MNNTHGKNNWLQLLLFLVCFILVAAGVGTTVHATSFRLIYGNDNLGELDGCG